MGWMSAKHGLRSHGHGRLNTGTKGESVDRGTPLARSENLVVEELGDEVLVYDLERHRAHCLSVTAALVWRRCDGETHVTSVGAGLGLDADTVDRALDELVACELLETGAAPATSSPTGSTRRQVMVKAAKTGAAVAAVPLIVSVAAPLPVQAATLAHCLALGNGIGNCGNACCQGGTGCCCCHKVNDQSTRSCVPTELCARNFYQPLPGPGDPVTGHCSCT